MTDFDHKAERRQRCDCILVAMLGVANVEKWWNSPNRQWNKTPNEQWEIDYRLVYNYLIGQLNGDYL